jgi:hypothetical protein
VQPVWIVLVMLLAWVIVALLEWVAWRDEPHWASGLPPRYYVPQQPLPPRPPTHELPAFSTYPQPPPAREDAPTWIATPELREELLGWPVAEEEEPNGWPVPEQEETEEDPWEAEALPEVAVPDPLPKPEPQPDPLPEPDPMPEPEPEPVVPVEAAPSREPRLARHRLDPYGDVAGRRRPWQRRGVEAAPDAELPSLPHHARILVREGDR